MKKKHFTRRRIVAVLLAAALAVGCLPFMTGSGKASAASTPNYNGRFSVYSTGFYYYPFSLGGGNINFGSFNQPMVYMEISANNGASWAPVWNPKKYMRYNNVSTIYNISYYVGGLRPNTVYRTRIYYGDIYGKPLGGYRYLPAIKTGMASQPAIKSVKCKAVNVKRHKTVRPGYYYWTGYHYIWMKPVKMKYYTYNVKVTVKLKKAPGTNGIFVNDRWLAGNKKKYSTKFNIPYPYNMSAKKPKGRVRYTVNIKSGQNPSWGGFSPIWRKTMKLK